MADKLNPGLIIGKSGTESGNAVSVYSLHSYGPKLYDMEGKEQSGIWSTTRSNGLFYIEFQTDPVEIAKFIDPETGRFKIRAEDQNDNAKHFYGRFFLVLDVKYLLRGGRSAVKDAPSGTDVWLDKVIKFVKKNSSFANQVLNLANIFTKRILTTEMWCATGFISDE